MGTRGRKSQSELAVISGGVRHERPAPPDELGEEAAAEWRQIAAQMPADWFTRQTWPLLIQYCRHVIAARRLAHAIKAIEEPDDDGDDFDFKAWGDLLKLQQKESAIIASLATKLRISQQSTYSAKTGATAKRQAVLMKKPWED